VQGRVASPAGDHGVGHQHRVAAERTAKVLSGMRVQESEFGEKQQVQRVGRKDAGPNPLRQPSGRTQEGLDHNRGLRERR